LAFTGAAGLALGTGFATLAGALERGLADLETVFFGMEIFGAGLRADAAGFALAGAFFGAALTEPRADFTAFPEGEAFFFGTDLAIGGSFLVADPPLAKKKVPGSA
jgi:hypothetical protein